MVNRLVVSCMCMFSFVCCFSQKIKTVDGEYTYIVPENVDLEKAKQTALERVKIQIIADEFGTIISQSNSTSVKNKNGKSNVDFISLGGSDVKGEWIETIGTPVFKTEIHGEQLVVRVKIRGKIREMTSANVDFSAHILRNGIEDKFEDDVFKSGDDLFLSFVSPVSGYVVVYLVDANNTAFCLMHYQNQEQGNVTVKANERYVFFSTKLASESLRQFTDEYTMTCSHEQELNQIYVVFSQNPFVKAVDSKNTELLPRELSNKDFQKWLSTSRIKDRFMTYKKYSLIISKE